MAALDRVHGSHGLVKMDKTGGATLVTVASLNKWELDLGKDQVKVTCFGDTNQVYVDGLPDIKGTYGGFYDPADGLLIFDAIFGTAKPALELYPVATALTLKFAGKANLTGKISVDANGAISISGAITAAGPWTYPIAA